MNTLQEYIQDRSVESILWHHASQAMAFMVHKVTEYELLEDREICKRELEKRMNLVEVVSRK